MIDLHLSLLKLVYFEIMESASDFSCYIISNIKTLKDII